MLNDLKNYEVDLVEIQEMKWKASSILEIELQEMVKVFQITASKQVSLHVKVSKTKDLIMTTDNSSLISYLLKL